MPAPKPSRSAASAADLNAAIARVTPDLMRLLEDGVPRAKAAIVAALADCHPKDEVKRTLLRLAVTGELVEHKGRFTLPRAEESTES
jgi:hypothetical protein